MSNKCDLIWLDFCVIPVYAAKVQYQWVYSQHVSKKKRDITVFLESIVSERLLHVHMVVWSGV